jgi:hypothetical protein
MRIDKQIVDDINGEPADETVRFSIDGRHYETDLTAENAKAIRDNIAAWAATARRIKTKRKATKSYTSNPDAPAIREWARNHGYTIPERGRIPDALRAAYERANA